MLNLTQFSLSLLEHSLSGYFLCLKHKRFLKEKGCLTPLLIVQRSNFLQSRLPTTAKISLYNFVCLSSVFNKQKRQDLRAWCRH